MKTSRDRLKWLIEFAQADLSDFKDWEWLKAKEEIGGFIDSPGELYKMRLADDTEPDTSQLTKQEISDIHESADFALRHADDIISGLKVTDFKLALTSDGSAVALMAEDFRHLFDARMMFAFAGEVSNIQTCLAPECSKVFYRVRKQKYCSKTCINRVSRREWLKKPRNKKKERKWAHERYERRVKAKTNGNVKVDSRPTRGNKKK